MNKQFWVNCLKMKQLPEFILLSIITSFVLLAPTKAKPLYTTNRLPRLDNDLGLPLEKERNPKLSSINVNIIVVPISQDPLMHDTELMRERIEFPTSSTIRPNIAQSFLHDLGTMSSSNQVFYEEPTDPPAQGLITPQPQHMMCKDSEIYDRGLGQCIAKNTSLCRPSCARRRGVGQRKRFISKFKPRTMTI